MSELTEDMETPNNIPISHTKVVVPRRREELLTRLRLLEMIFEFLDKKLILISAPAGYGKTSLLIDLSYHSDLPFCWLSLDALDQDLQRFVAYFIEALAERFPGFGVQSKAALNDLRSFDEGMEQLLVTLVNEIYERVPQHFVLVLDDYHLIGDIPVIQNFLSRFIQLVDENCHLIVSSRALPKLPDLTSMVARDMVGGLDFSALAFQADEIQKLFAQNYNLHISDETAQELVNATEGWITGLQLSGLGIAQGVADRLRVARAAGVGLFDYLGEQVLSQQPEDVRFFLLRSSLLEEFDASLCEAVFGELYPQRKDWQRWINTIIQNNLFALPVGVESGWVRYHHLFRDFLQDHLSRESPEEIPSILRKLSQAYEKRNEWEKAYHTQKSLGDADQLAGLIERAAPHLLLRALVTLETWLKGLPPSVRSTRPGLLSIQGIIEYMKGNLQDGLDLLNRAEAIYREMADPLGLSLTLVRRAAAHRFLGDYPAALQDAEEVIDMTASSDELQFIFADALRQKGLSLFRQGQSRQSVKVLERALEIHVQLDDFSHIPLLMMETGMAYAALGKEDETKRLNEQALQIWKRNGNLTWQANTLNNLGVLHYLQGDYDKAVLLLEEGLLCAKQGGYYIRIQALLLISLGDVYAEVEDFSLADQYYQRGQEIAEEIEDRFLLNYLSLARANLLIQQRHLDQARRLLDAARESISFQASQYEDGLYHLLCGQLFLHEKEVEQAIEALEYAGARFEDDGRKLEYTKSQFLLAAAYYQCDKKNEARNRIREVYSSESGSDHPVVILVRQFRPWFDGLKNDPEVGRVLQDLVSKANQIDKKMPEYRRRIRRLAGTVKTSDAKLTIQAFGRAQVRIGERQLSMSDWQTQSVRDLFFYFLLMKDPRSKEQVGEVFWPEIEEPSRLKIRFKNDIYRLRRAVGSDAVLFDGDHYSFNRGLDYESDGDAFEDYLYQAELTTEPETKIGLLQKAVELVNGHFLEDINGTWILSERERLDQLFIFALMTLADLLKKANRVHEALAVCQRAIKHEPSFEPAYMLAMKLHVQLNDRRSAIRLYESYTAMMDHELDLPPSPEMEAMYKSLTR
jgi:ATP/maltotriose-dependent transcriptional regulator MalT/two-component SAPR family response regulator